MREFYLNQVNEMEIFLRVGFVSGTVTDEMKSIIFQMIQNYAIRCGSKFALEFGQNQKDSNQKAMRRIYLLNLVVLMPVSVFH